MTTYVVGTIYKRLDEALIMSTKSKCFRVEIRKYMQLTLLISKSKGLSEIVRDIRTSTYQICRIEVKEIEQPLFTNEYVI